MLAEGGRLHAGVADRPARRARRLVRDRAARCSASGSACRRSAQGGALRRLQANKLVVVAFSISGALAGLAGIVEVTGQIGQLKPAISPGYGFTAITVAFLGRLHPVGMVFAGLVVALTVIGGESAQIALKLPLDLTTVFQGILLICVLGLRCARPLPRPPRRDGEGLTAWASAEAVLLTVHHRATPLLIAAIGELVVERAGVLNLGIEGMMAVGAACGFAGAILTGSTAGRRRCGDRGGRGAVRALRRPDARPRHQPGGDRPRADDPRPRPLRADRRGFVGTSAPRCRTSSFPGLSELPVVGQLLFGEDPFVYVSIALASAICGSSTARAPGLMLRSIGENHTSAHALGYPVLRIRYLAILFGGACAGLGGAYLSLVYTPFWSPGMTAGPRLDRAGAGGLRLLEAAGGCSSAPICSAAVDDAAAACPGRRRSACRRRCCRPCPISRPSSCWSSSRCDARRCRVAAPASLGPLSSRTADHVGCAADRAAQLGRRPSFA